ncbi:trypsin-like serine protease, partial [Klebsiella pneumoniae]|nr:trypsin-like serine protease [Klebsiella pneumoniae]
KTMQEARVRIINQSVCNKLYDDLITSRMLCAGNLNGGVDACQVIWNLQRNYKGIFAFIGKLFGVVSVWFFVVCLFFFLVIE